MDAQRVNVYTALYEVGDDIVLKEKEVVLPLDEVIEQVKSMEAPIVALGEAADKYADRLKKAGIRLAPPARRCALASSVARAAFKRIRENKVDNPLTLVPNYIRRSEAEVQWEKRHGIK
jgi:tRNA threonylcarbamoyladenosine biosynthesis protein TsaB